MEVSSPFLVRSRPREQDARLLRETRYMSTLMSNTLAINLVLFLSARSPLYPTALIPFSGLRGMSFLDHADSISVCLPLS